MVHNIKIDTRFADRLNSADKDCLQKQIAKVNIECNKQGGITDFVFKKYL